MLVSTKHQHESTKLCFTYFLFLFSCQVTSKSTTPWTAACQASLSLSISWSLPKFVCIKSGMPSKHLILFCLLLLASIFPNIRIFSDELAFHIRWPKYLSFSFSISPSNEYSGLTGLMSLHSKGLSRVFSSTTV